MAALFLASLQSFSLFAWYQACLVATVAEQAFLMLSQQAHLPCILSEASS